MFESNKENYVAVQTPNGLSRRETFKEIVMQGDVLAPLISSLQVDTMGKECLVEAKHLYYYKNKVAIPPLGLVTFEGQDVMKVKEEQMYLGDIISSDGKHDKNIKHRKNKVL